MRTRRDYTKNAVGAARSVLLELVRLLVEGRRGRFGTISSRGDVN